MNKLRQTNPKQHLLVFQGEPYHISCTCGANKKVYLQVEDSVLKPTKEVSKASEFFIEEVDWHYFQISHERMASART